jgi:anti-anti-sigma factor
MIRADSEYAFEIDVQMGSNGSRVVALSGDFDLHATLRFKDMTAALLAGGCTAMVVSLDRASYIDSTALGALIGLQKRLNEAGGSLAVICSNRQIRTIFEATGLLAVFRIREAPLSS